MTWRATAENCAKYLAKGRKVGVTGEIRTRNYEKDGVKHYVTEILANTVEFLTSRNQQGAGESTMPSPAPSSAESIYTQVDDDDLPF